ncbi:MAG: tetratricopeptide repeat protein [Tenacibaculum sp.]|nr:tetratricopeptide repeat protein [Tenacibaculum sp.]
MKKQIITVALGISSMVSFAQKKELRAVEKALKNNDYATAITAIKSVEPLIANADDKYKSMFYFLKGKAFAGKKDYTKASEAFVKLFNFNKTTGKDRYTSEARPILNKMLQEVSNEAVDLYNNKKDYKAAAEKFYLTYKLSPKDTLFAFNAAVSAQQAKDYDTALKYYRELQNIGYTGVQTQYLATNKSTGRVENMGSKSQSDLMVKTGKYIKPEVKVTESQVHNIAKNIALILKEQGKTEEAINAMEEARKANPKDMDLIFSQAQIYSELKRMDKFGELMKEAISLRPNDPMLYYNLGVVNFNQGKIEEAKNYYKKAIELKPDYSDAYMNLAVAILDKEKAIVDEMNENMTNFKKYDELALKQKGVYREALPYLEKADKLNRKEQTVKTLMSIYEVLEMTDKVNEYKDLYKSMKK